jgi:hypothetical protein
MNILITFDLNFMTSKKIESFDGGDFFFIGYIFYVQNFMNKISLKLIYIYIAIIVLC